MNNRNINITGLSRSGNHAVIFWIIYNYVDNIEQIEPYLYINNNKLCFINNVNHKPYYFYHNYWLKQFDMVIQSYEDEYFNRTTDIIIVRDFLNMLCSRYKKYCPNIGFNNTYIYNSIHTLISVWKQHMRCTRKTINYNLWTESKEYRDNISKSVVGIPNNRDKIDYISCIGEGSSFNDNSSYNKRYSLVKLPEYIIDHILIDKELLDMNKKFFKIDIEKCLLQ